MAIPRPTYEVDQMRLARGMRDDATMYGSVVQRRLADVADSTSRLLVARGRGNADAMQQMGGDTYFESPLQRTGNTPFQRVLMRSRALARVGMMGDDAVLQQQFRDRVGLATIGQQFRANQAGDLSSLARDQAETNAARMRASQTVSAARNNLYGSLAGIGLGLGVAAFNKQTPPLPPGSPGYPLPTGDGPIGGPPRYDLGDDWSRNRGPLSNPYGIGGRPGWNA